MPLARYGDWLHDYPKDFFGSYDKFGGKIVTQTKNVLYIQPLIYKENSQLTPSLLKNLHIWLEAYFQPCKVEILPSLYQEVLDKIPLKDLGTQENCYREK